MLEFSSSGLISWIPLLEPGTNSSREEMKKKEPSFLQLIRGRRSSSLVIDPRGSLSGLVEVEELEVEEVAAAAAAAAAAFPSEPWN